MGNNLRVFKRRKNTKSTPPKKFEMQKDGIYRVALDLFKNRGYDKTSVQEIAKASNLQKGSLYYYISSKENLLFEMIYKTVNTMVEMIESVEKKDLPPREKLCRAIEMHLLTGTNFLDEFSVMVQETKYLSPRLRQKVLMKRKEYELAYRKIIEEGIKGKGFKKLDVGVTSFMILGALNWVYQWYSSRGPLSPEEISDIFCQIITEGICKG